MYVSKQHDRPGCDNFSTKRIRTHSFIHSFMPFKAPNKSTDTAPPFMLGGKKSDLAYGALKRAIMRTH